MSLPIVSNSALMKKKNRSFSCFKYNHICLLNLIANIAKHVENQITKSFEPRHDKTNKMTTPSEDSDQPGHPPSLIRVFAARMKKAWVLSYPLSAQRRL